MRKASEKEMATVAHLGEPFIQAYMSVDPALIAPLMVYVNATLMMNMVNSEGVSRVDGWDEIAKATRRTIAGNEELEQAHG